MSVKDTTIKISHTDTIQVSTAVAAVDAIAAMKWRVVRQSILHDVIVLAVQVGTKATAARRQVAFAATALTPMKFRLVSFNMMGKRDFMYRNYLISTRLG